MGLRYLSRVVTLELNSEKCTGCKICVLVCPHAVFAMNEKKAEIGDRDACMECGACAMNCPEDALTVRAGVGCAYAILVGSLKGSQPTCDPFDSKCCQC